MREERDEGGVEVMREEERGGYCGGVVREGEVEGRERRK